MFSLHEAVELHGHMGAYEYAMGVRLQSLDKWRPATAVLGDEHVTVMGGARGPGIIIIAALHSFLGRFRTTCSSERSLQTQK